MQGGSVKPATKLCRLPKCLLSVYVREYVRVTCFPPPTAPLAASINTCSYLLHQLTRVLN